METKDVNNILDIPNISKYLDCIFSLSLYEPGDKNMFYDYWIDDNICVHIDFMLSQHPPLIEGYKKLSDIIMMEGIGYFKLSIGIVKRSWDTEYGCYMNIESDLFQKHHYRPGINDEKKQY